MNEQDFRDYHLVLDGQAEQIFGVTDDVEDRAHKIGGTTPCSISEISEQQRLKNSNEEFVARNEDE
jgi:starvation-inducible DNA-binding protein